MDKTKQNTLNICLGHVSFPKRALHHLDIMIGPRLLPEINRFALVPDNLFGPDGSSLSEYAQLIWIYHNLDRLLSDRNYVRIFHYRRFVSPVGVRCGTPSTNQPWSTAITEQQLDFYDAAFERNVVGMTYNSRVKFAGGVIAHYAHCHVLEDFLNFATFLLRENILPPELIPKFLSEEIFIPACNIGVFDAKTFKRIFGIITAASGFLRSPAFVVREGYQRRNCGFLLERLNSFLLLQSCIGDELKIKFGSNIVLSDTSVVSITT